jgi:uncharacterized protein
VRTVVPVPSEPNLAVVQRLYGAFADRDLEAILAVCSPDIVVVQADELPWGGTHHGHDGLVEFLAALAGTITSRVETKTMFVAGDHVIQGGTTAGTVNASGAAFSIDEVHVFTVADGVIVRFEAYIDTPAMLDALHA